jgi:ferredoxin-nitrite reductase
LGSVDRSICPDIYHPAVARDGLLTRLRIPGGELNSAQCLEIEDLLAATGLEYLQVTNRANLQLRALAKDINPEVLAQLTAGGLAAQHSAVDGIRSVMLSPTAGIDAAELIDVRPLAAAWQTYLDRHPELGILSTKFSVGLDGGGSVGIIDRPNDITLLAINDREFSLYLGMGKRGSAPIPVGVALELDACISMLAAIAQTYRRGTEVFARDTRRKPRLRDVIHQWGLTGFCKSVEREFNSSSHFIFKNRPIPPESPRLLSHSPAIPLHLGVHKQRQPDRYYLGVILPLGRWQIGQITGIAEIADRYGSGTMRLTPWQNIILPDVGGMDVERVQVLITDLGLIHTPNHPSSLLRACAGSTGCQFGATDTQRDAIDLSNYLANKYQLNDLSDRLRQRPLNIHFSGCDKSCAQHDRAEITLWGVEGTGCYRLEIDGVPVESNAESIDLLTPERVPIVIGNLIESYLDRRIDSQESLRAFIQRQSRSPFTDSTNLVPL